MTNETINLARLAYMVGQISECCDLTGKDTENLIEYAKKFTAWEEKNVLTLPNGWEDYINRGNDDYESLIYKKAEEFVNEYLR